MSTKGARNYRPKLHFTPESGWMNDPNGLLFENGRYHLFYQYHPNSTHWGPMHWGHAVSSDLVSWEHRKTALYPDKLGTIFSGSAVYDTNNTSGLGQNDRVPIVTMFTHNGENQSQSLAYSLDGENFIKYQSNPVIPNPGLRDFRDPRVFYNPIHDCWSAVVAAGDHLDFYSSTDLKSWIKTGEFNSIHNPCPGIWECPDLFPLFLPHGSQIWVLLGSMVGPERLGGHRTQYMLGSFDGDKFIWDHPTDKPLWLDSGFDNYAGVTFSNIRDTILMSWASNWKYADKTPTGDYCGAMTLPRKLALVDTPEGPRLSSEPCINTEDVFYKSQTSSQDLSINSEVLMLDIESDGKPFIIRLSNDLGEYLSLGLDEQDNLFVDRRYAGQSEFSSIFADDYFGLVSQKRLFSGSFGIQIIFDVSILEVFADNGTFACTQTVYPTRPYNRMLTTGRLKCNLRYL